MRVPFLVEDAKTVGEDAKTDSRTWQAVVGEKNPLRGLSEWKFLSVTEDDIQKQNISDIP